MMFLKQGKKPSGREKMAWKFLQGCIKKGFSTLRHVGQEPFCYWMVTQCIDEGKRSKIGMTHTRVVWTRYFSRS